MSSFSLWGRTISLVNSSVSGEWLPDLALNSSLSADKLKKHRFLALDVHCYFSVCVKKKRYKRVPESLSSIRIVIDLAEDGRKYNLQYFQSIESMCFTIDCFPWFTGVITDPPPACSIRNIVESIFQIQSIISNQKLKQMKRKLSLIFACISTSKRLYKKKKSLSLDTIRTLLLTNYLISTITRHKIY